LIVLALSWSGSAGAMTLGGPAQLPGKGKLAFGVRGAWLAYSQGRDADLKSILRNQNQSWGETDRINRVKLDNDAYVLAELSYGLLDNLGLTLGVGQARGGSLTMNNADAKLGSELLWSLGAKYRLMEDKNGMGVVFSARYMRYDNREVDDWRIDGETADAKMGYSTDDSADFYQLDGVVTLYWKRGRWTPYLGAGLTYWEMSYEGKWHNAANGAGIDYDATLKNNNRFTALAGFEVELGQGFKLNLEGVFVGRTEIGLSLGYAF
jgi:hypothetical protein